MRARPTILASLALLAAAAIGWAVLAGAGAQDADDKSAFIRFVEQQISSEEMQIRLGEINGALYSDVTISEITVADGEGIWLTFEGVHLIWNRLALLSGTLDVDLLEAGRIVMTRAGSGGADTSGAAFEVPELPTDILIDRLAVPQVEIAEAVFGLKSQLAVDGNMTLEQGSLAAHLAIERTDRAGGLTLDASYANASRELDLAFAISEPEGGVIATGLGLRGRPAVDFTIEGAGPLADFRAEIGLSANGERLFAGPAMIAAADEGYNLRAELAGGLENIVDPTFAPYFGADAALDIDATRRDDGSVELGLLRMRTGLARLEARGSFAADGVPVRLRLDADLGAGNATPVPLPATGGASAVGARITASLGESDDGRWSAHAELDGLVTSDFVAGRSEIRATGTASNLADAQQRQVALEIAGSAGGLSSRDEAIGDALGSRVEIAATGEWRAGAPVKITSSRLSGEAAGVQFAGEIGPEALDGDWRLVAPDLSSFAGIVGRELGGAVEMRAQGTVARKGGGFDLALDGTVRDLETGAGEIDPLLAAATTLTGGARRDGGDYSFTGLTLENGQIAAQLDGSFGADAALALSGRIGDVAVLSAKASGALSFEAALSGPESRRSVRVTAEGHDLALMSRPFAEAVFGIDGLLSGDNLAAALTLSGTLGGVPLDASARIERQGDGARAIREISVTAGQASAAGEIAVGPEGDMDGRITIDAPQLSVIAPLLLTEAAGALEADIELSAPDGRQNARIRAAASGLRIEGTRIDEAHIDVAAEDIFAAPAIAGTLDARGVLIAGIRFDDIAATATRDGADTAFSADAGLERGRLAASGTISPAGDGFDLTLAELSLASELGDATLARPANVEVRERTVLLESVDFRIAGGSVELSGAIGETLDVEAAITAVPLAVANALAPFLDASGTVSGVVSATGSPDEPSGSFELSGSGIGAQPLSELGIERLDVEATGTFDRGTVDLEARTRIGGGDVRVAGRIGDTLDLEATFADLPLEAANAIAGDLDLTGSVTGRVSATGSLAKPVANFAVTGRNVGAGPLSDNGVQGLAVEARGSYADRRIVLDAADFAAAGLSASARGTVPLSGRGLDLAVAGEVPLSLTDRLLIDRGARLGGTVTVDIRVRGSRDDPSITGAIAGQAIQASDPGSGLSIRNITLDARLDGERVSIARLDGTLGAGRIAVAGAARIAPELGYPVDLSIALSGARYEDGHLVAATLDGELSLRGALEGELVLAGALRVERAEISVPESLPTTASLLDVEHRDATPPVLATLRRAGIGRATGGGRTRGRSALGLDIAIVAPSKVFVRGRGIDTELGGEVRLVGPVSAIRPVGALRLRSGRIDILGKRVAFERGELTLVGDLDPNLDFVATSRGDTVSVTVTVYGRASNPEISFSSVPELPEDEVLSQLLFGRGIDRLSPLQIGQLGLATAELAGGGGPGILEQLRAGTGLDNLDITSDSEGNIAVEAGRYVSENVYLGVKGGEESSGVTVNLDIARGFTARAEAGQKDSRVGVFYELEY